MISPWTWFFASLFGVLVAAGIAATIIEVKRHYSGATLSWRHTSASTNGNHSLMGFDPWFLRPTTDTSPGRIVRLAEVECAVHVTGSWVGRHLTGHRPLPQVVAPYFVPYIGEI